MVGHILPELLAQQGEEQRFLEGFLKHAPVAGCPGSSFHQAGSWCSQIWLGKRRASWTIPVMPGFPRLAACSTGEGRKQSKGDTHQVVVQRCQHALGIRRGWHPAAGDIHHGVQPVDQLFQLAAKHLLNKA